MITIMMMIRILMITMMVTMMMTMMMMMTLRHLNLILVGSVDHVDDGVDSPAVTFPHRSEPALYQPSPQKHHFANNNRSFRCIIIITNDENGPWLATDVPKLDGDVALADLSHVEPNCRNLMTVDYTSSSFW